MSMATGTVSSCRSLRTITSNKSRKGDEFLEFKAALAVSFSCMMFRDVRGVSDARRLRACASSCVAFAVRGQDGSLLLSCKTFSFSTSCRFIPARDDVTDSDMRAMLENLPESTYG